MEYSQTHSENGHTQAKQPVKQVHYNPLVLQCGSSGETAQRRTFKTWFLCWSDLCNPHWTVVIWTVFSLAAYCVDVGLDLVETAKYYSTGDNFWASAVLCFILLPHVVSVVYFMIALRRPWYEVYPTGMLYCFAVRWPIAPTIFIMLSLRELLFLQTVSAAHLLPMCLKWGRGDEADTDQQVIYVLCLATCVHQNVTNHCDTEGHQRLQSWKTVQSYCALPCKRNIATPDDARIYITKLRTFRRCNRERTRASDLDIYFGAIPQLIVQSYMISQKTIGKYDIPISSWLSLCSSAIFVLRYEPSARHGQKGMIVDLDTVLEPAVYDYVMENFFDFIFVVPRVIAIGCFLTAGHSSGLHYVPTSSFFPFHLTVAFIWFWLSAPKKDMEHADNRSADRDFRGTRRYRNDWFEHIQASVASLVLPPTNKTWPTDFLSWKHRLRAVLTKQFCVVTVFQFVETAVILAAWCSTSSYHVAVVATALPVFIWITARMIFHVLYYAFIQFPFYTREWEYCVRRRGLIGKTEIIRMAEELGGYFCPKLGPRLHKVHRLLLQSDSTKQLDEELEWLSDRFQLESVGIGGAGGIKRGRTQRHRLMAMGPQEKDLMKATRRLAAHCREYISNGEKIPSELHDEWLQLIRHNNEIASFWSEVLLATVTHHYLPSRLHQVDRDLSLSIYPKMFHNMVIRNNLHSKRIKDRNITIYSKNRRRASAPSALEVVNIVRSDEPVSATGSLVSFKNLEGSKPLSESFGEKLNFEFIENEPGSGVRFENLP